MTPEEILKVLNFILETLGNVSISEAKTWAEVEKNAQDLRAEGHEDESD